MSKEQDILFLNELMRLYETYMDLDQLRARWYSLFDPSSNLDEQSKEKIVSQIKQNSVLFGDAVQDKICLECSDTLLYSSGGRKIISICPTSFLSLKRAVEENPAGNLPGKYLTVSVLVSGLPYSSLVESYLRKLNKSHGMVLLSNCREGYESTFESGKIVPPGLYIPKSETKILEENPGRPVLVVDECISEGDTLRAAGRYLKQKGYNEIYYLCGSGTIRESDGLTSPLEYNKYQFPLLECREDGSYATKNDNQWRFF